MHNRVRIICFSMFLLQRAGEPDSLVDAAFETAA